MALRNMMACFSIIGLLASASACIVEEGDSDDEGSGSSGGSGLQSCTDLCSAAQAGDCTAVTGDCDAFCGALERAAPTAGCEDERQTYHQCVDSRDDVCDSGCFGYESDLEDCMIAYCAGHQGDADCVTLVASY